MRKAFGLGHVVAMLDVFARWHHHHSEGRLAIYSVLDPDQLQGYTSPPKVVAKFTEEIAKPSGKQTCQAKAILRLASNSSTAYNVSKFNTHQGKLRNSSPNMKISSPSHQVAFSRSPTRHQARVPLRLSLSMCIINAKHSETLVRI